MMHEDEQPRSLAVTFPNLGQEFSTSAGITIGERDGQWTCRHEASGVLMELSFLIPGPSEVHILSPCCQARSIHMGARAVCSECEHAMPNPYAEQDGELIGEWSGCLPQWLDPHISPLAAVTEASAIESFLEDFELLLDKFLGVLALHPAYEMVEQEGEEVNQSEVSTPTEFEGAILPAGPRYLLRKKS